MNEAQRQYINNPSKYKQIIWDYNIKPQSFFEILNGQRQEGWLNRDWATSRVLENVNYYDAIDIIDLNYLTTNWSVIKPKIFNKNVQNGYNYVLQKRALSTAR